MDTSLQAYANMRQHHHHMIEWVATAPPSRYLLEDRLASFPISGQVQLGVLSLGTKRGGGICTGPCVLFPCRHSHLGERPVEAGGTRQW